MRAHAAACRVKRADLTRRERLFHWRGDFHIRHADGRDGAGFVIRCEQFDCGLRLLGRRAPLMNRLLRRRDVDGAREPCFGYRTAPEIESIAMRCLWRVNEHFDGKKSGPVLQRFHG